MEELIKQFNLPDYLKKAKSFSDASKIIMSKFEGREDSTSKRTMAELMGRLRDAQEFVKAQSELETQPEPSQTEEFAEGGLMESLGGLFKSSGGGGGSPLGMAAGLAKNFIGKKDIHSDSSMALHGALDGVSMGSSLGPIGMIGGAVAGGAAGLINAGNLRKKWGDQQVDDTAAHTNKMLNTFKYGGKTYDTGGLMPEPDLRDVAGTINLKSRPGTFGLDNNLASTTLYQEPQATKSGLNIDIKGLFNKAKTGLDKTGDFLGDNVDKLRYAPVAINAAQLMNMKEAPETSLNRLDARYNPQYTDEQSLQNIAREGFNTSAEALAGASGGSTSALRSNILASGLNRTRALSSSMNQANQANMAENRAGQQFDLNVDRTNLQQDNLETDIRARDKGAFETAKSAAMTRLGQDLGNIGKEDADRDIIKKLFGYDTKGNYLNTRKKKAKALSLAGRGFNPGNVTPKLDLGGSSESGLGLLLNDYLSKIGK